jgi:hypothetical protein
VYAGHPSKTAASRGEHQIIFLHQETITLQQIKTEMPQSGITTQASATKSRPDILIVQGESVGGRENARESQEEHNLGKKRFQKCPECHNLFLASICFSSILLFSAFP